MKKIGVIAVALCAAGSAGAADFSFTGNFEHGDEVQEFYFTVESASDVTLRTWSYAGGTNAAGTGIEGGGFDPIVALFDAGGQLLSQNDDSGLVPDPVNHAPFDSLVSSSLVPGSYTATVTQFASFALGPTLADGFRGSSWGSSQTDFGSRDSHWALDILNADSASLGSRYISPIPEPESYALLLAGLGLVFFMGKERRRTGLNEGWMAA